MSLKDSSKKSSKSSKPDFAESSSKEKSSPAPFQTPPKSKKKGSLLLDMKEFAATTTHLPNFTHLRKIATLTDEEKKRKLVLDTSGRIRIVRSTSLTQISTWAVLVPPSSARAHIVIDRNERRRKKSSEKEKQELVSKLTNSSSPFLSPHVIKQNTDDLSWEKTMSKTFVEELEQSRRVAKERRTSLSLSSKLPSASAAAAATMKDLSASSAVATSASPAPPVVTLQPSGSGSGAPAGLIPPSPGIAATPSGSISPQGSPRSGGSAIDKSGGGSTIHGKKEGSKIKERLAKDESNQVGGSAFPGIRVHTNQESSEDRRSKRLVLLAEQGIEIGSFSQGSPLILAGTLEKIVEKLGNWLVSAMRDATSNLQVNGFLWTYEKFCSHLDLLNVVINLYKQAPAMNIPEASREKFLKKKREGVLAFLCSWLSDETLSPKHRDFLHEAKFQETLHNFLKNVVSSEYARHVNLVNAFLRDTTHRRTHPRYLLTEEEAAAKYKPKEELFGLFGRKNQSFDDVLEINIREIAEQLTYLDYDAFLEIDWYEVYHLLWMKSSSTAQNCAILVYANRAKQLTGWVATQICDTENISKRAEICSRFVDLADKLYELNNFHSLMQVLSGLNHGSVLRLNKTWAKVSASHSKRRDELTEMMAQFGAYKNYRQKLEKRLQGGEPVVPCLDVILRDFALADENPKFVDENKQFINFDKCMWMVTYLEDMRKIRSNQYPLSYTEETQRERNLRKFLRDPKPVKNDTDLYAASQKVEPRVKQM